MSRPDRLLAAGLFAITAGWCLALSVAGSTDAPLYLAPALLVALPLALGRYFGDQVLITALEGARRARACRPLSEPPPVLSPVPRTAVSGGTLIAASLAERAPPTFRPLTA